MGITRFYYLNVGMVNSKNYEELIGLINQLDNSSIAYMDYKTDSGHLVLSKEVPMIQSTPEQKSTETTEAIIQPQSVQDITETVQNETVTVEASKTGEAIESPMVGVAYLQPSPDEPSFVKVGDRVEQGDVVCIIEAMKLMNEIQAPRSGVITEILIENEEVVEYKQPLFFID